MNSLCCNPFPNEPLDVTTILTINLTLVAVAFPVLLAWLRGQRHTLGAWLILVCYGSLSSTLIVSLDRVGRPIPHEMMTVASHITTACLIASILLLVFIVGTGQRKAE